MTARDEPAVQDTVIAPAGSTGSDVTDGEPAHARPSDFTVLLPPGWLRLPTDDTAEGHVARMLALRLAAVPAGQRSALGRALRRLLLSQVQTAREQGAFEIFLLADAVRGRPVSAACLVSLLPAQTSGPAESAELVPFLEGPDVVEVGLEPVGGELAVRRVLRTRAEQTGVTPDGEPTGTPETVRLEYLVPVPGTGGARLLLAYSTTSVELAEPLCGLFDAITSSLRWVA